MRAAVTGRKARATPKRRKRQAGAAEFKPDGADTGVGEAHDKPHERGTRRRVVRIGTSGWHYKHWRGPFYPEGLPSERMLAFYAERFDTVELNTTFYHLPRPATIAAWERSTPEGFCFAVKGSRYLTHMRKLTQPDAGLARFLPLVQGLGSKLGPILFQLPPRWRCNPDRLARFLEALPTGQRFAFELRDPSWHGPEIARLLARHNAAFCIYDLAGFQSPLRLTADFAYVRLHGPGKAYQGRYSAAVLETWAARIEAWASRLEAVHVYFDNDQQGFAVQDAAALCRLVGQGDPLTARDASGAMSANGKRPPRPRSSSGALAAFGLLAALLAGCFAWRSPDGGGETSFSGERRVDAADVALPPGYRLDVLAKGLTFPTGVTFDQEGRAYVVESGYSYGEVWGTPRLLRIEPDGRTIVVVSGENNGPWDGVIYFQGAFYVSEGGTLRGGRILKVTPEGTITALVDGLPSMGDHQANGPVVGPDGWLYFGVGTMTNAGVVGPDNAQFGWLRRFPDRHDIPCADLTLVGQSFASPNPLTPEKNDTVQTGAFLRFGQPAKPGQRIPGRQPCNGAIMRARPDGGPAELVAWGFRNPFGLALAPDGRIYVTDNMYDDRGSRPIHGTGDLLWLLAPGSWYGWPDFHGTLPLDEGDHFVPPGKTKPERLLQAHPAIPPKPAAVLGVHSSSNGLDFSRSASFGHVGEAFIAQFGDQSPSSGKVLSPVGFKVVRVDVQTGVVEDFAVNRGRVNGPASKIGGGGLERPVAVRFDPPGEALYVVDFGVMTLGQGGKVRQPWGSRHATAEPRQGTGVLWKITREGARSARGDRPPAGK